MNDRMKKWIPASALALALAFGLGFVGDALAQGCAMCRTALGPADDPLAQGFYWSVLLLISAPYTVAGVLGGWLVYRYRAAARDAGAAGLGIMEIEGGNLP